MSDNPSPLSNDQIAAFRDDGAICLRGVFAPSEVEVLRDAVEDALLHPGPNANAFTSGDAGKFVADLFVTSRNPAMREVLLGSALGEVSARLMASSETRFFFDHMLVKEPGGANPTPWHQDAPYFPINGVQCCGIWVALDDVTADNGAVEYLGGTHKDNVLYAPERFSGDGQYAGDSGMKDVPDVDNHRGDYNILSWELAPGDCVAHHVRLLHGAPANSTEAGRRRGIATRWIGDDIVYATRPEIPDNMTDSLAELAPELVLGAPFDHPQFPVVWAEK